jgi:hypothetical protein
LLAPKRAVPVQVHCDRSETVSLSLLAFHA